MSELEILVAGHWRYQSTIYTLYTMILYEPYKPKYGRVVCTNSFLLR